MNNLTENQKHIICYGLKLIITKSQNRLKHKDISDIERERLELQLKLSIELLMNNF